MVIVDTSVIIDHLRQQNFKKETILLGISQQFSKMELGVSVLSIQELYVGLSTKDEVKENFLKMTILPINVIPYTYEIAVLAGKIIRDTKAIVTFADAGIASTCIYSNAKLVTLNQKDFIGIKDLELYSY